MSRFLVCVVLALGISLGRSNFLLRAQEAPPSAAEALTRLKEGNDRFAADKPARTDVGAKRRARLTQGQQPFAVVLSCADSRVPPEIVFDQGLGDLFVLRVAGNIADTAMIGSAEYAVQSLKTPLIVVLGHEDCGAVQAALNNKPLPGDLGWLIKQVHVSEKPAGGKARDAGRRDTSQRPLPGRAVEPAQRRDPRVRDHQARAAGGWSLFVDNRQDGMAGAARD